jgi:hypothetical protein
MTYLNWLSISVLAMACSSAPSVVNLAGNDSNVGASRTRKSTDDDVAADDSPEGEEGTPTDEAIPPDVEVDAGTPMARDAAVTPKPDADAGGKTDASLPSGGGGGADCQSVTLGREVSDRTCVQRKSDRTWWRCQDGLWAPSSGSSDPHCSFRFPL